jgi:peptide/nickel transport system substrate-binding protein
MIPVAHGAAASAALASVDGAHYPPFGAPQFEFMNPGKDTFVYMQNNEPISLFCADETDGESLSPCQQVVEPLFAYETDSGSVVPRLATGCEANDDLTVWTCALRTGVRSTTGRRSTPTTSCSRGWRRSMPPTRCTSATPAGSTTTHTCGAA